MSSSLSLLLLCLPTFFSIIVLNERWIFCGKRKSTFMYICTNRFAKYSTHSPQVTAEAETATPTTITGAASVSSAVYILYMKEEKKVLSELNSSQWTFSHDRRIRLGRRQCVCKSNICTNMCQCVFYIL